jgi:hypothetical protein
MRNRLVVLATAVGLVVAASAQAGHHLWDFTEMYSNSSGSVQFVEMFTAVNGEAGVGPFTVVAGANTFNFVTSLADPTVNTYLLIATSGFGSLPGGVTPDYIIPGNFFATGGGTLNYAGGVDVWNYGTVPTDGVSALLRNGSTAPNTPTNFAGNAGSVDLGLTVPALGGWGMALLIGSILLFASGLIRRRQRTIA